MAEQTTKTPEVTIVPTPHTGRHRTSMKHRPIRRGLDVLFALPIAFFGSPIIALAWIGAAWSTKTRGLFRQLRVGLGGVEFDILKLRTMIPTPSIDSNFTAAGDPRITRFGAILRQSKIDELPQVFQVMIGQMTFVGPRPDVRQVIDQIPDAARNTILSVRPGITGLATLYFRDEEQLLARVEDPEQFSLDQLLSAKTDLNLAFIRNSSAFDYLRVLWLTFCNADLNRIEALITSLDPHVLESPVFAEISRLRNGAQESVESISIAT